MNRNLGIGIAVAIVLIGLIWWAAHSRAPLASDAAQEATTTASATVNILPNPAKPSSTKSKATQAAPATTQTTAAPTTAVPGGSQQGETFPSDQSFIVNASLTGSDTSFITVPKGIRVTVTFNVGMQGTPYGGVDFKSPVVSTGNIPGGESRTVSFIANDSFIFTPYEAATGKVADYRIGVVVK